MPAWIEIAFLLVSLLLGTLPLYLLRRHDIHDPEPFPVLTGSALVGGFIASATALIVFTGLERAGIAIRPASWHSFAFIGPVEEAAKLAGYYVAYRFFREYFDEPIDRAIYMGAVAVGFSAIENAAYAAGSENSGWLLLVRLLVATPVHVVWSLFVGLGIARAERTGRRLPIARGILIASLLHGLWDYAAFRVWPWALLHVFFILLFFRGRFILSYLLASSHLRPMFLVQLERAPFVRSRSRRTCPACGQDAVAGFRSLPPGPVHHCAACERSVVDRDTLYDLFHYYGSMTQGLWLRWRRAREGACGPDARVLIAGNCYDPATRTAHFKNDELAGVFEDLNVKITRRYRRLLVRV